MTTAFLPRSWRGFASCSVPRFCWRSHWHEGLLSSLRGQWRWLLFAVIEITIPFPLIAAGELHVASSLAAILIAAAPLFVAVLAIRFDATERVTEERLAGLLIGLGGVVALVGVDVAGDADELVGAAAILFSRALLRDWADDPEAPLRRSRPSRVDNGSARDRRPWCSPAAALDPPSEVPSGSAIVALVVLGIFCTAAAFAIYATLVAEVGAGQALVITYVAPVVAVALGVAILGEQLGGGDRRAAADPGGIVARSRRASTAGPGGGGHPAQGSPAADQAGRRTAPDRRRG